ncbi:N-acetyltransferase [Companilactobacillus sp. RD055328]|uniref:GNAT family N-acetyltransferase n=1 Tax=Companilactobacillus sp. RD055328 TaxID=2916634 RepID=UPI001FC7E081|nr:GNAT family N-acetyltransferase [Companilactobacillus sp. RD055328]GKQ43019.1 N-acetyltransferase [Companilactobacillus sp. RD055328]
MIRAARKEDVKQVLPILNQIFEDMELDYFKKIGQQKLFELLEDGFTLPDYRYSYENILVDEEDGKIVTIAVGYPAELEEHIDDPLIAILDKHGLDKDQKLFEDTESWPGEWYLDSLAVHADMHHQGYGKKMLEYLPEYLLNKGEKMLSLNADVNNIPAQKLYEKMGFKKVGQLYIGDHLYDHMQLDL